MEVNGYLPVKVFSSDEPKKQEPDILTKSLKLDFLNLDRDTVIDLKSGGKDEELYKYLILSLCNYLNDIMPFLFEPIEDYTELLFPERLLHTDSLLGDLNDIIDEGDWKEVEVIGWIYQDYIAKKKDFLIQAKKQYHPNQIATVTQLFTPKWIVKYMVQNSLGKYWLESHPNKDLQSKFEFYLGPREENYLEKLKDYIDKTLSPEDITFIDPAMGSGHILVYAFEVFYEIYKLSGYTDDEIPKIILTKNLYGLEIDDRAAQLAGFALLMKARQYDKRLFEKKIELNIAAIQETNNLTGEDIQLFAGNDIDYGKAENLFDTFKDAKTYGSIINVDEFDCNFFKQKIDEFEKRPSLRKYEIIDELKAITKQANIMAQKYDVTVTNPPYLNSSYMPANLKKYLNDNYPNTKSDLFSVFIEYVIRITKKSGHIGMVSPYVWMFLKSYEWLRNFIVKNENISSLIQLEYNAFSAACVPVCTFTIRNQSIDVTGEYIKLSDFRGADNQPIKVLDAIKNLHVKYRFTANSKDYSRIPGSPIAYWMSDRLFNIFDTSTKLKNISPARRGLETGNNEKFLKQWHEVELSNIFFNLADTESAKKMKARWVPHNKGGLFQKWYGNNEYVVFFENDGEAIRKSGALNGYDYYFREGITWTALTSSINSFRYSKNGFLFDSNKGPMIFDNNEKNITYFLSFLNTPVAQTIMKILNPTLSLQNGDMDKLPIIFPESEETKFQINNLTQQCIDISREEWDSRETSWDFTTNELLRHKTTNRIEDAYNNYCTYWKGQFFKLHSNEEELNRIFINIYDLADELTPDVPLDDITILKTESEIKDGELVFKKETLVKQFISYSVGCMFGRYSRDKEGLILANQGETIYDFREKVPDASFMPDDDNIIPILEDEYFTDDIVSRFREFLKATFGAENLAENLEFIAGALSKSKKGGGSPEKVIRDYFLKSFFKDHVKMYKKRPVYWLFTSGKGRGFNALVYMHRYDKETLAKMRTDYLLKLEDKLDARIQMLGDESGAEKGKLGKQVEELMAYDAVLNNKALEYIDIDLDDGVKVNYAKFEGLVGKV